MTRQQPTIDKFDGEYRWLSNFYPVTIEWAGRTFKTLEHAYQACKAEVDEDLDRIAALKTPGQAKRAGQKLKKQGLLRANWPYVRLTMMEHLLRKKFAFGTTLWHQLMATGDAEIIEGNPWHDTFFGVCQRDDCDCPPGENHLGKLLMQIRSEG